MNDFNPSLENFEKWGAILLAIIGLITLIKGFIEFRRQGKQKRSEQFLKMREKYAMNKNFKIFFELLEDENNEELKKIGYKEKLEFLGFYEELALMVNTKLINKDIAYYMFGYYAIKCWDSDSFWIIEYKDGTSNKIQKENTPWALFKHFVQEMKKKKENFEFKNRKMKF